MILVFAGAGASKAVNPQLYPTTLEFFDRLPDTTKGNRLFAHAVTLAKKRHSTDSPDIEQVLWILEELAATLRQLADKSSSAGWFFAGNAIAATTGHSSNVSAVEEVAPHALSAVSRLSAEINRQVYAHYAKRPTEDMLASNWIPLLKGLRTFEDHVELVTTNYDLVIEEAIRHASSDIETGRTTDLYPTLQVEPWRRQPLRPGRLTKLHGSVDWKREADDILVGNPQFIGDHSKHVILYPGYKGAPEREPFIAFHDYFTKIVATCTHALFIGYAFRDPYVNDVLKTATALKNVVIINPDAGVTHPIDSAITHHTPMLFDRDSVTHSLSVLGPHRAKRDRS